MTFKNLTGKNIRFVAPVMDRDMGIDHYETIMVVEADTEMTPPIVQAFCTTKGFVDGIPVNEHRPYIAAGFPDYESGVIYLVMPAAAEALHCRVDVFVPCGPCYDKTGEFAGYTGMEHI